MSGPKTVVRGPGRGVIAATIPSAERIEQSTHAMWHDPTTYDPIRHGPPYLRPGTQVHTKTAAEKTIDAANLPAMCDEMCAEYGSETPAELAVVLAWLRAASHIHQTHHWQTRGPAAYTDHKLFDELYTESQGMIDAVAERAVGSLPGAGHVLVDPLTQAGHITRIVWALYAQAETPPDAKDYPGISLGVEKHLLAVIEILRGRMEIAGRLTSGTDNLLQGVSDTHERFVYLLQQRAEIGSTYQYGRG